jgi:hypothetical protein
MFAVASAAVPALLAFDPLVLESDVTIDVPAGETLEYATLAGGAFTLTKTGGGTLVFETISNSAAKVVVSAGALDVRTAVPPKPAVLSSAWLHLDATDSSTMTCSEIDGVSYVAQWRDANGGDGKVTLTGFDATASWSGASSTRHFPFLSPSFRNGRTVVDLGSVAFYKSVQAGAGHGGAFGFSTKCTTMRETFLVVGDTEDAKRSYVDYGKPNGYAAARCVPLLGTYNLGNSAAPFIRGSIETYNGLRNSALIYMSTTLGADKCDWTMNGVDVANETTELLPDGLNLVEIRAEADSGIEFNSLGTERGYYAGGLRYGEVVIFDELLSAADREELRAYLSARWLPIDIAGLELGEGASLVLANDVTLRVAMFKASGAATVSGNGSLKIMNVDRMGGGVVTYSQGSQTLRPDASGDLPDLSFPSGGSMTTVDRSMVAKAGHLSASGAFVKMGAGALSVSGIDDGVDISVDEGVFVIDPLSMAGASWFHLDASITNSSAMTTYVDNGTNFISSWYDTRYGTSRRAYNDNSSRQPMLAPGFQNGLPVVDFGGFQIGENPTNVRGRYMAWNVQCSNIRDVFTVASDSDALDWNFEEVKKIAGTSVQYRRGAPFVGAYTANYDFLRESRPEDGSKRPGVLNAQFCIHSGTVCILDGTNFTPSAEYPAGFHVLNIKPGQDTVGNAFAIDRYQVYGGTRIGEFMVFTNEVPPRVRSALNGGLMSKWLGGEKALVYEVGDVSVAKGAKLELPYCQALAPNGDVSVAGALEVGRLLLSGSASFAATASFAGDLELASASAIAFPSNVLESGTSAFAVKNLKLDGGTVNVSFAAGLPKTAAGVPVKLMSFSSVEGTAKFHAGAVPNGMVARVFAGEDGLYAVFFRRGMIIRVH